jgi:hypothetical protein
MACRFNSFALPLGRRVAAAPAIYAILERMRTLDVSIEIRDCVCHLDCRGDFNFRTFAEAMGKLVDHPGFLSSMDCLWDCRAVDVTSMTTEDTSRMLAFMEGPGRKRGAGRTAVVLEEDVAFGMGRMYALRSEDVVPGAFNVFRTKEAALAWLADRGQPGGGDE